MRFHPDAAACGNYNPMPPQTQSGRELWPDLAGNRNLAGAGFGFGLGRVFAGDALGFCLVIRFLGQAQGPEFGGAGSEDRALLLYLLANQRITLF
ncbi:MAG TPA: hypothetical protein VLZ84_03390 [Asticcacaulis sp.]|nr:hypothetical protein [Asticcacaulis sp.]